MGLFLHIAIIAVCVYYFAVDWQFDVPPITGFLETADISLVNFPKKQIVLFYSVIFMTMIFGVTVFMTGERNWIVFVLFLIILER